MYSLRYTLTMYLGKYDQVTEQSLDFGSELDAINYAHTLRRKYGDWVEFKLRRIEETDIAIVV